MGFRALLNLGLLAAALSACPVAQAAGSTASPSPKALKALDPKTIPPPVMKERYDAGWSCNWVGDSEEFPMEVKGRTIRACKGRVQCRHAAMKGQPSIVRDVFYCEAETGKICEATYCLRFGDTRELTPKNKARSRRSYEANRDY